MIVQSNDTNAKASLIDLLGGNSKTSSSKSNDLFSQLLSSLSSQTKGEKLISASTDKKIALATDNSNFKAVIDLKKSLIKSGSSDISSTKELQSLLLGDDKASELVSKEMTENLTNDQVRSMIHQAKEYLKNQITAKSPEYANNPESLPKTLGGLVKLADKLGLDPQSITLSTIADAASAEGENILDTAALPSSLLTKPLLDSKISSQLSALPEETTTAEAIIQLLGQNKPKERKEETTSATDSTLSALSDKKEKADSQPLKTLLQSLTRTESQTAVTVSESKSSDTKSVTSLTSASTDSLKNLLQGDSDTKESKNDTSLTAKNDTDAAKTMQPLKADSLEVKGKEAQQSMRHFATDLKEAVENYKPPFTKLTMKLNPEKLGEVEVTLVQRGNNVHVNIQSSNATSVAFLAHNATELKAQLAHQGITNATMNFMSGGEGQTQNQNQQNQQQQNRFKSYQSFEELELNEEQLAALEIVIPNYA